jgi:hypothetical protein
MEKKVRKSEYSKFREFGRNSLTCFGYFIYLLVDRTDKHQNGILEIKPARLLIRKFPPIVNAANNNKDRKIPFRKLEILFPNMMRFNLYSTGCEIESTICQKGLYILQFNRYAIRRRIIITMKKPNINDMTDQAVNIMTDRTTPSEILWKRERVKRMFCVTERAAIPVTAEKSIKPTRKFNFFLHQLR